MIQGIGTDIIEIERICSAIKKETFLFKTFTKSELDLYTQKGSQPQTLAALFCANSIKIENEKPVKATFKGFLKFFQI